MPTTLIKKTPERLPVQPTGELNFGHLRRLLTEIGVWQHTVGDDPSVSHGYSIDDEARALIVGLRHWQRGVEPEFNQRMADTCLRFIQAAALSKGLHTGSYHNFCNSSGLWLDSIGSEDSFGRTLWGLGVAYAVDAPFASRQTAGELLRRSLAHIDDLEPLRSKAFALLGLAYSRLDDGRLHRLADELCDAFDRTADAEWRWFEDGMTYCNARLPHALFVAAGLFPEQSRWGRVGTDSLSFLLEKTRNSEGSYSPIGNLHMTTRWWFRRGDVCPPLFDQQPVDAGVLVEACAEAARVTGEARFRRAAHDAYGWYFGANVKNQPVYRPATGGVGDAITRSGVSANQGAESVLSIHLARQALQSIA